MISVTSIRDCLNNISTDEVSDNTITDKINDAKAWVGGRGANPDDGSWGERACKYYAAYLSYIVSNTYLQATAGPITVREAFELKANTLLREAQDALARALGYNVVRSQKILLKREYTLEEQEEDPDSFSLVV